MKNAKLVVGALAVAAVGCGVSACSPNAITAAGQNPAPAATVPAATGGGSALGAGSPVTSGVSTGPGRYILQTMPIGTVSVEHGAHGHLQAQVTMFGLTPGSSHQVSVEGPLARPVRFPALTANAAGQADATLTSVDRAAWALPLGRFVIRLGDAGGGALAAEPIAETSVLPLRPGAVLALHAVTFDTNGRSLGRPAGRTTLSYNASAQTLTITVTASGLNPGPHAAHIHLGSCQNQGSVKYMMPDFIADANGNVIDQTRVVTGVTSVPGPGSWYLNLHQGGMNQILANGAPTLSFRPMLCTDITSVAMTGTTTGTPTAAPTGATPTATAPTGMPTGVPTGMPTGVPTVSPTQAMPTGTPTMTMPAGTPTGTPSPSTTPTGAPTAVPTHY